MLNYFMTLTDDEIKLFVNTISCERLSKPFLYTTFYDIKEKIINKKDIILILSPDIIVYENKNMENNVFITNEDIEYNQLELLITDKGIFNNKKFLFFKRKRMTNIEKSLIDFLVKKEKNKRKEIKHFSFSKINK